MIKLNRIRLIMFFLLVGILITGCTENLGNTVPKDIVIAKVNGESLTLSEYNKNLILFGNQYETVFGKDIWNQEIKDGITYKESFRHEMFERMIIQELIFQESEKLGLKINEKEIIVELELYKEKNKDNEIFFSEADTIIDDEFLKKQFEYELIVKLMKDNLVTNGKITKNIVENYYSENKEQFTETEIKASHILFKTVNENLSSISDTELEAKYVLAETVLKKILNGESFELMAIEYSEDPLTANKGGDLEYFKAGEMAEEFNRALEGVEIGGVSGIIQTIHGYHIIKLYDRIEEVTPFEEVMDGIISKLQNDIFDKEIIDLYENAEIIEYREEIDSVGE